MPKHDRTWVYFAIYLCNSFRISEYYVCAVRFDLKSARFRYILPIILCELVTDAFKPRFNAYPDTWPSIQCTKNAFKASTYLP